MSTWNAIIPNRLNQSFHRSAYLFEKKSEIAVLVVKEICPGSWQESCSVALAGDGANWQENGSGGVEEEFISIFRAGKNCSILEQLLLLSWKYHKPSPWTYFIVHNYPLYSLYIVYFKKRTRLSSSVQAHGESQKGKSSKICSQILFIYRKPYSTHPPLTVKVFLLFFIEKQ